MLYVGARSRGALRGGDPGGGHSAGSLRTLNVPGNSGSGRPRDRHRRARAGSGPVKAAGPLRSGITEKLDDVTANGDPEHGLPNT